MMHRAVKVAKQENGAHIVQAASLHSKSRSFSHIHSLLMYVFVCVHTETRLLLSTFVNLFASKIHEF